MLLRRVHPSSGTLPDLVLVFWYFCLRPSASSGAPLLGSCFSCAGVSLVQDFSCAVFCTGQSGAGGWLCRDGKALKRVGSLSFPCLVVLFVFQVPAVLPRDKMVLKGSPGSSPCPATGQNPNFSCPSAVLLHKVMLQEAKQPLLRFASP